MQRTSALADVARTSRFGCAALYLTLTERDVKERSSDIEAEFYDKSENRMQYLRGIQGRIRMEDDMAKQEQREAEEDTTVAETGGEEAEHQPGDDDDDEYEQEEINVEEDY